MVWAVDYDPDAQVSEIAFNRTGVYRCSGVPPAEYDKLMKSDSIGSHVKYCIISVYSESRVE